MPFEPVTPAAAAIPLCAPEIRGNEWSFVKDCLDSGWVSSVGSYVDRFESDLSRYVGSRHGIATVNGTAALHVALLVAGVCPDDEVLVSTLSFIAPANAIRYAGAWPVFMDADPVHWQMDSAKVVDFAEKECRWRDGELRNKATGRRIRAILPVHILGHPVDMAPLLALARKFNLAVIEDATESIGAEYRREKIGQLGTLACFSFNGNKLITAGGGGMIVTNDEALARKARYLTTQAKDDPIEYIHNEVGFNYRLTNLQAAVACAQLEKIDDYIEAKRRIAATYCAALEPMEGLTTMQEAPWARSVFWMFTILVDARISPPGSRGLLRLLAERRIQTRPLWQPLHQSHAHLGAQSYYCEVAPRLHQEALSLPCSVGLKSADQNRVIESISDLL